VFLLIGGVFYTIGAMLYLIGKKKNKKYMHSVFHIFVDIAAFMHFFDIFNLHNARMIDRRNIFDIISTSNKG